MKIVRILCLLLVSLMAVSPAGAVLAQEEPQHAMALTPYNGRYDTTVISGRTSITRVDIENQGDEAIHKITFSADTPENWAVEFDPIGLASLDVYEIESIDAEIKVPAGTTAGDYMVTLKASGTETSAKDIDIRVTVKTIAVTAVEEVAMSVAPAISLKPGFAYGETHRLVAAPPFWPLPEPGEYDITLEAVSGEMTATIELKAVITARYSLVAVPSAERYDTKAEAGKDNYFSIEVGNLGTADIENIQFSSNKPAGWTIEFSPDKVDLLEALSTKTVDVNIKPPPETIAGDYVISLRSSGTQATSQELQLRVTVETPTVWGWVGVAIIVLVIIGLVVIFMRFSRR